MKMGIFINESTGVKGEGLEKTGSVFRVEVGKCKKFILGHLIALTLTSRGVEIMSIHRKCLRSAQNRHWTMELDFID